MCAQRTKCYVLKVVFNIADKLISVALTALVESNNFSSKVASFVAFTVNLAVKLH